VLFGHPTAAIVFFSLAAACYGLVLLSALFGSTEISRRGFRLLGMAENPTENGRGQVSPKAAAETLTCVTSRSSLASDGSEGGGKR
jgi:hypothetical protein